MTILEMNTYVNKMKNMLLTNVSDAVNSYSEYNITEDSFEIFENLIKFCLSMEVKNSEAISQCESDVSTKFSNLLIKYYFSSLDYKDIKELLTLIYNYNKAFNESLNCASGVLSFLEYIFGFESAQEGSLTHKLMQLFKKYFKEKTPSKNIEDDQAYQLARLHIFYGIFANNVVLTTENVKVASDNYAIINYEQKKYRILNENGNFVVLDNNYSVAKYNVTLSTTDVDDQNLSILYTLFKKDIIITTQTTGDYYFVDNNGIKRFVNISTDENKSYVSNEEYKTTLQTGFNEFLIKNNMPEFCNMVQEFNYENNTVSSDNLIKKYYEIFCKSYLINYKITNNSTELKFSASASEKNRSYSDVQYSEFNLCFLSNPDIEGVYEELNTENIEYKTIQHAEEKNENYITIGILYKEFNPLIRDISFRDLMDPIIGTIPNIFATTQINNTSNQIIDANLCTKIESQIKNTTDNFIKVFYSNSLKEMLLSLKSNPYKIRRARESDIIGYFSGSFIGYGLNNTERTEIMDFIDIYEETRDYFYRNLLNKALIKEDNYNPMEKLFITTYSIERFISSKIDNIRDIDSFNANDIKNFLISYGLKAIEDFKFSSSLESKKRIIYKYKDLMKMKGSDSVISILLSAFNTEDIEAKLEKYLIFPKYNDAKSDNSTAKLEVLPIDYISKEIPVTSVGGGKAVDYEKFIENSGDGSWTLDNVGEAFLKKRIFSPTATKYTSLTVTQNILSIFIKFKYALSYIKTIFGSIIYPEDNFDVQLTDLNSSLKLNLKECYSIMIYLFETYLNLQLSASTNTHLEKHIKTYNSYEFRRGELYTTFDSALKTNCISNIQNNQGSEYVYSTNGFSDLYKKIINVELLSTKPSKYFNHLTSSGQKDDNNKKLFSDTNIVNDAQISINDIKYILDSIRAVVTIFELQNLTDEDKKNKKDKEIIKKYLMIQYIEDARANGETEFDFSNNSDLGNRIDQNVENFYFDVYQKLIYFPQLYIEGYYHNIDCNKTIEKWISEIFELWFLRISHPTPENPELVYSFYQYFYGNSLNGNSSNENFIRIDEKLNSLNLNPEEKLTFCYNSIIELNQALQDYLLNRAPDLAINFGFREDNQAMLKFMTEAVNLFLSYTSYLYKSSFIESFSSEYTANRLVGNAIKDHINSMQVEYFFYDEKIKIKENNGGE